MRLRFPAYGAALMALRRDGHHPTTAHLVVADRFPAERQRCHWPCVEFSHPEVKLRPREFARGVYDWRMFTGLLVVLFDGAQWYAGRKPELTECVLEILEYAADVEVLAPELGTYPSGSPMFVSALQQLAYGDKMSPFRPGIAPASTLMRARTRWLSWLKIMEERSHAAG